MQKMIRISEEASNCLSELAEQTGTSKQDLLSQAITMLSRKYFLEKANRELEEIAKDPQAWREYLEEHEAWDSTLLDGLEESSHGD